MAAWRFSILAELDLAEILNWTEQNFEGAPYLEVIKAGLRYLAATPGGPYIRQRPELGPGVCTYHLRHSRTLPGQRTPLVKHPRHFIVFRSETRLSTSPAFSTNPATLPGRKSRTIDFMAFSRHLRS